MDKYGPPTRTNYKVIVENLSTRVSWQVRIIFVKSLGYYYIIDCHYGD